MASRFVRWLRGHAALVGILRQLNVNGVQRIGGRVRSLAAARIVAPPPARSLARPLRAGAARAFRPIHGHPTLVP